ncbi:hypothetical protein CF319_g15 [Tilletia indica]|nr:hypothetical protein CF319_g15 [Tilletia indica]
MPGRRIDPVPTRITASWRVMHIPELFAMIAIHLEREMVDLVALSTVSKHVRLLTLPHMVRYLDVRVTRSDEICRFFDAAHPSLVNSIEFIRIREDDIYEKFRHRPHSKRTKYPVPRFPVHWKWGEVGHLLHLIENRRKTPLPRIDVSIGASDLAFLKPNLDRSPKLMKRVCALRILVDIDGSDHALYPTESHLWAALIDAFGTSWDFFPAVIQDLSSPNLVLFEMDNSVYRPFPGHSILPIGPAAEHWSVVVRHLARHVKELSVAFCYADIDLTGYQSVLSAAWPKLRKAEIKFSSIRLETEHIHINQFLVTNGARLERLGLDLLKNGPVGFDNIFPKLQTLSLPRSVFEYEGDRWPGRRSTFGLRHSHSVRDWSLSGCMVSEVKPLIEHPLRASMFEQMRVLRASKEVAEHFIRAGARPAHLQLDAAKELDSLQFWRWINSKGLRKAAETITCLDIEISNESLSDLNLQLGHVFASNHFPNLQELVLCSTSPVPGGQDISPDVAAAELRRTLIALRSARKLRALRIEHMGAVWLPPDRRSSLMTISKCPPALEYVSWHVHLRNSTQYFRVVRKQGKESNQLQHLPPSFRVKIRAEDGVWEQESDLRRAAVLFDHSGRGRPELILS